MLARDITHNFFTRTCLKLQITQYSNCAIKILQTNFFRFLFVWVAQKEDKEKEKVKESEVSHSSELLDSETSVIIS